MQSWANGQGRRMNNMEKNAEMNYPKIKDHSRMGDKIFDIGRIRVDIIFTDQKRIKIKRGGQSRILHYDKKMEALCKK